MQAEATVVSPVKVRATLNYMAETGERQVFYNDEPGVGGLALDPHQVEIEDASFSSQPPRLEVEGFELFRGPTAVRDLALGLDSSVEPYTREMEPMIRELVGADYVTMNPRHLTRRQDDPIDFVARKVGPAPFIHSDTSHDFGRTFTAVVGEPEPGRKVARMALIKLWRLCTPGPTNLPFALLDARTMSPDELVPARSTVRDGSMELEMVLLRHNPAHRWVYFSQMKYDDVIVFKQFDTDPSKPWCAPHSAFIDTSVTGKPAPRASHETGIAAYWYDD